MHFYPDVRFVAHVHHLVFGGQQLPVEIGISSVLQPGETERDRQTELWTIFHTKSFTARDDRINRVATRKTSTLPHRFLGAYPRDVAECMAVGTVGHQLVGVKGESEKRYLKSIGINCVDLEKLPGGCPRYRDVPKPNGLPQPVHVEHDDPWQCSLTRAIFFARHVEQEQWARMLQPPPAFDICEYSTYIPPPVDPFRIDDGCWNDGLDVYIPPPTIFICRGSDGIIVK